MPRDRLISEKRYKKPWAQLKEEQYPEFKHIPKGYKIEDVAIKTVGIIERDGRTLDYQDIRVYMEFQEKE